MIRVRYQFVGRIIMVQTQLAVAGMSAVIIPTLAAPLISRLPGGAPGALVVGTLAVYGGSKLDGLAGAIVVGTGAGLIASVVLSYLPQMTVPA